MATPEHVEIVRKGAVAFVAWRKDEKSPLLDLEGADLSGCNLQGMNLSRANLRGANLQNANLTNASLSDADLTGANLQSANLTNANFSAANLTDATLINSISNNVVFLGSILVRCKLDGANFASAFFQQTKLIHSSCVATDFTFANFTNADLSDSNYRSAKMRNAIFHETILVNADLSNVDLHFANIRQGDWSKVRELGTAINVHTVIDTTVQNATTFFHRCHRPLVDRLCDWEALRGLGRLPLFGASYSVLISMPIFFYLWSWYNIQVSQLQKYANDSKLDIDQHLVLTRHLEPLPFPSLSGLLLLSTVLLAVASTLYVAACPSKVKEFTRDVWCDQLNRSLFHYWPLSWRNRSLRIICGLCYAIGGLGAGYVLLVKIFNVGHYIFTHSI